MLYNGPGRGSCKVYHSHPTDPLTTITIFRCNHAMIHSLEIIEMTSLFRNDEKEEAVEVIRKQMEMLESHVMGIIATIDHVTVVTIVKVVAVVAVDHVMATEAVILNSK